MKPTSSAIVADRSTSDVCRRRTSVELLSIELASTGLASTGLADMVGKNVRQTSIPSVWLWVGGIALLAVGWLAWARWSFPPDTDPRGAYLRIVKAVNQGRPADVFPYTEERAQHACYTIRDYRRRALERAREAFPKEELRALEERYGQLADAPDGRDVFAIYAAEQGWLDQLRADLSGIEHVEVIGKRATVVTAKKTRYAFRRRPNGIWGLTAFSPTLVDEAEKAARDWALIEKAAEDYARARDASPRERSSGAATEL